MDSIKRIKDIVQGKATLNQKKRSSKWPKVRAQHLKEHPLCSVCGGKKKLEVHHIIPYNERPDLELDPSNLITLCESKSYGIVCHLLVGHLGSYRKCNKDVVEDSEYWKKKIK